MLALTNLLPASQVKLTEARTEKLSDMPQMDSETRSLGHTLGYRTATQTS